MKLRRVGYVALGILVVWFLVGFLATMPVVGNHPFWRQIRARPRDFGLKTEDVYFPADDGISLHAWYIPAEGGARGTVILAHGIDGNASDMLPARGFWRGITTTRWWSICERTGKAAAITLHRVTWRRGIFWARYLICATADTTAGQLPFSAIPMGL